MKPSAEQTAIIDSPLKPLSVIACAGSGKTATAIRRVVKMRKDLGDARGRIALLSFSNVAVDTFRAGYKRHSQALPPGPARERVDIDTLDSFITTNILRPHAHRTMGSARSAFLVTGSEVFLKNYVYKINLKDVPTYVDEIDVAWENGQFAFYRSYQGNRTPLRADVARACVEKLGLIGAYTYDLGRYWCCRILQEQPQILNALVRRYPHIVVDEAQDIGQMHQKILEMLMEAGAQVTLIGDPHQSIYEFAGANGQFLTTYKDRAAVGKELSLTTNYRSLPVIVDIANVLSGRKDDSHRKDEPPPKGAYFIGYDEKELPKLVDAFHAEVARQGISHDDAAILCRSKKHKTAIAGAAEAGGQGVTKLLASAAVLRDVQKDHLEAYRAACGAIVGLLAKPPVGLLSKLSNPGEDVAIRTIRRKIWAFARNTADGLPSGNLNAKKDWHPLLVKNVKKLLGEIDAVTGYGVVENIGRRVASTGLVDGALNAGLDLAAQDGPRIRTETVHQVKGESIDAVLYIASSGAAKAMMENLETEDGRIGYVAVTRARDLLWVAAPNTALKALKKEFETAGFRPAGGGK